jgi:stearoyl-CoA desaturase (delta-9 desaturase)
VGRVIGRPAPGWLGALFALSGFGQQVATLVHDVRRVRGVNPPVWLDMCRDFTDDRLLTTLERPFVTTVLFVGQLGAATAVGGWAGLVWLWALHLVLTNASWAVNSVCHAPGVGRQPHATGDDSRDVHWLSAVTLGESYHNTHHRYPRSACHGIGGFDPSWWVIQALVAARLASDVWLPREARPAAKRTQ